MMTISILKLGSIFPLPSLPISATFRQRNPEKNTRNVTWMNKRCFR